MKIIIAISLIYLCSLLSAFSQNVTKDSTDTLKIKPLPNYEAGFTLPLFINMNNGTYKAENKNNICCNDMDLTNVSLSMGSGFIGRVTFRENFKFLFWDSVAYGFTGEITFYNNYIKGSNYEPPRKVLFNDNLQDLIESNEINITSNYIGLGVNFDLSTPTSYLVNFDFNRFTPFYRFGIGPFVNILINDEYEQTLRIENPMGYTYKNGINKITKSFDSFEGLNPILFGFNLNFESFCFGNQIFNEEWLGNIKIGLQSRLNFIINSLIENQSINNTNFSIALNLSWYFFGKQQKPDIKN